MLANLRVQTSLKALLLLGLGFFLFTRLTGGTLYFYISERFGWLTVVAALGLFVLGISYRTGRHYEEAEAVAGCEHDHADGHPGHDHSGHDHSGHDHPGHDHAIGWGGLLIVALPILFGLLIPPRPLRERPDQPDPTGTQRRAIRAARGCAGGNGQGRYRALCAGLGAGFSGQRQGRGEFCRALCRCDGLCPPGSG